MRRASAVVAWFGTATAQSPENFQLVAVTKDNFVSLANGKDVLVRFCDPSKEACMALSPSWDSLTQAYKQSFLVGDVDCGGAGKSFCDSEGVKDFPTIKFGKPEALKKYDGELDDRSLRVLARSVSSGASGVTPAHSSSSPAPRDTGFLSRQEHSLDGTISCGQSRAASCASCPNDGGENPATWCSGDCLWNEKDKLCASREAMIALFASQTTLQITDAISCGKSGSAPSCAECPRSDGNVASWCSGDCLWNEKDQACASKQSIEAVAVPASTTVAVQADKAPTAPLSQTASISCGKAMAKSCDLCPKSDDDNVAHWCNGDCLWDEQKRACGMKPAWDTEVKKAERLMGYVEGINCGQNRALSCAACPKSEDENVAHWCSGDCLFDEQSKSCVEKKVINKIVVPTSGIDGEGKVSCGKLSRAASCSECPKIDGQSVAIWCNGDCLWNEKDQVCAEDKKIRVESLHEL